MCSSEVRAILGFLVLPDPGFPSVSVHRPQTVRWCPSPCPQTFASLSCINHKPRSKVHQVTWQPIKFAQPHACVRGPVSPSGAIVKCSTEHRWQMSQSRCHSVSGHLVILSPLSLAAWKWRCMKWALWKNSLEASLCRRSVVLFSEGRPVPVVPFLFLLHEFVPVRLLRT